MSSILNSVLTQHKKANENLGSAKLVYTAKNPRFSLLNFLRLLAVVVVMCLLVFVLFFNKNNKKHEPMRLQVSTQPAGARVKKAPLSPAAPVSSNRAGLTDSQNSPLYQQAAFAFTAGDYRRALNLLQKIVPSDNGRVKYLDLLARTYVQLKKWNYSTLIYKKLLSQNRSVSQWWLGLGLSYDMLQRYPVAKVAYLESIQTGHLPLSALAFVKTRLQASYFTSLAF